MMGIVYLICDAANGYFKIGVTRGDIKKRMKKLQTGNPTELFLKKCYKTKHPFYVEKCLHQHFGHKKVLNEWFDLSMEEIGEFVEYCRKCDHIVELMKDNPFFKVN